MAVVVLDKICKTYGNNYHAIKELSLTVRDGEFLILVGPSGCGKSTALRMIAGLEEITSGTLSIGGQDVADLPPKDRDIAMVFQNYALYPHMTVFDNIAFSMKLAGRSKAERTKRVHEIAKTLQLETLLANKPAQLSGGQRQRVAMGRAMVREPAAFLMDEPLSNLDAKLRVQMRAEIASLQRQLGVTTIYVTHDQTEALTMGDRVAVLKGGVLQQVDTPRALYNRPVNAFVAGFIGSPSMNLFEGRLQGGNLQLQTFSIPLPASAFERAPGLAAFEGRTVVFGIRPEDLYDSRLPSGAALPSIPALVKSIEELGSELIMHLNIDAIRVDSGDPDAVEDLSGAANVVAKFEAASAARMGQRIDLAVDATKLHFFNPQTHRAL
ncbi:sn-glycerol-3-phosphate ABC transporter ATP-binding protein UgpC [Rhizobium sp. TRM95111]|uniref:ABC transporter ATP-binding protein n=1 Tax=Rhizobium alarense TaxID=2846851 RepID=UPI001F36503F|nr:sn-glycerol-3-phosphate ABC transporter ATP-binding protein UgpC [Rhizobium alarense]MCF3642051.1 sn-glycerol-3-phosphate ABC transporter ATP-binding protein UgpC [Rhizobium alarense]